MAGGEIPRQLISATTVDGVAHAVVDVSIIGQATLTPPDHAHAAGPRIWIFLRQRAARALHHEWALVVPAGVVGQVWRDGRRQARLARLLATDEVEIEVLDDRRAREAGQLCGARGTADVIDASVVLGARARGHRIVTSDPEDIERLDPRVDVIVV